MTLARPLPEPLKRHFLSGLILFALGVMYLPVIIHWCDGWISKSIGIEHEYFSHALIGLPYAAFIVWEKRFLWRQLPERMDPAGLVLLLLGAIAYLTGVVDWVNLSFPLILTGICLWLKGRAGLKLQAFPLLLVWLSTPNMLPYLITPFTLPLQKFIAGCAGFILLTLGMDVAVEEIYLSVQGQIVEVAPYCAGLKMLFTSLFVALVLMHWTGRLQSRKLIISMLLGTASLSVFANILRNTLLAYWHGTGNQALFHWLHESWGGELYSTTMLFTLVILLRWLAQLLDTEPQIATLEEPSPEELPEEP